jgi:hypothetical protein
VHLAFEQEPHAKGELGVAVEFLCATDAPLLLLLDIRPKPVTIALPCRTLLRSPSKLFAPASSYASRVCGVRRSEIRSLVLGLTDLTPQFERIAGNPVAPTVGCRRRLFDRIFGRASRRHGTGLRSSLIRNFNR